MGLLDKMVTYVRVVEAGSFSAAAKQLRISSGAVSRQIATLEEELSMALLRCTTRRMAVTSARGRAGPMYLRSSSQRPWSPGIVAALRGSGRTSLLDREDGAGESDLESATDWRGAR